MNLGELILTLEAADQDLILPVGFDCPHSYRGLYCELAFCPAENVSVRSMLECAKGAIGTTYTGWKGGGYTMHEYTSVWIADHEECGETLGQLLLGYMLRDGRKE